MKEYIMTLLGASLIAGIVGVLCPKKHKKYLRLVCGFCVIAAMVAPLPSYLEAFELSGLDEYWEEGNGETMTYEEIYHQTLLHANTEEVERQIQTLLSTEFSIPIDTLAVSVELANGENTVALKNVTVAVSGIAILTDPREISGYVESVLHCPCEIIYKNVEKS